MVSAGCSEKTSRSSVYHEGNRWFWTFEDIQILTLRKKSDTRPRDTFA